MLGHQVPIARLQSTPTIGGALTKHAYNRGRAYKAPNQRYECHLGIPRLQSVARLQSTPAVGVPAVGVPAVGVPAVEWGDGALTKHACSGGMPAGEGGDGALTKNAYNRGRAYKAPNQEINGMNALWHSPPIVGEKNNFRINKFIFIWRAASYPRNP